MGVERDQSVRDPILDSQKSKARLTALIMLLLGLLAPVFFWSFSSGWDQQVNILSMFWVFHYSSTYPTIGFQIIPPYAIMSIFPFLLLRLVPVIQVYRYYKGKTTRLKTIVSAFIGDAYFLMMGFVVSIFTMGFVSQTALPLPWQLFFGAFLLWRYPIPDPIMPWEGMEKHSPWWEKSSESAPKKAEDELW